LHYHIVLINNYSKSLSLKPSPQDFFLSIRLAFVGFFFSGFMYPPNSSKSTAHDGGGDADTNQYDSAAGATRDFSSLGPQTHHHPPPQRQQQHQQNPNLVGHYLPGEPSSIGFDSNASSSSSLFRHRSSPAGFYDQHLPTDPNGNFFVSLFFQLFFHPTKEFSS